MIKLRIDFFGGFEKKSEELTLDESLTYFDLLNIFKINPETVIVVKNGKPVPLDERVEEGEIKILRVISGG
jgi:sulfur carrier protein